MKSLRKSKETLRKPLKSSKVMKVSIEEIYEILKDILGYPQGNLWNPKGNLRNPKVNLWDSQGNLWNPKGNFRNP